MKGRITALFLLAALCFAGGCSGGDKTGEETKEVEISEVKNNYPERGSYYVSPYREIAKIGDPFALYDEDTQKYYIYCTGGLYKCWSSDNLKTWTEEGNSYQKTDNSFGTQKYWAPEVYKYKDAYYMVYSAGDETGRMSIGVARSDSPKGPFTDIKKGSGFRSRIQRHRREPALRRRR